MYVKRTHRKCAFWDTFICVCTSALLIPLVTAWWHSVVKYPSWVFPKAATLRGVEAEVWSCWEGGGVIGVKRIHLPLFDLTCTLGTSSGRDPGRHTVLSLAMGIYKEEGDFQGGGALPLNHYHCWHQWKAGSGDRLPGHLRWVERRLDSY